MLTKGGSAKRNFATADEADTYAARDSGRQLGTHFSETIDLFTSFAAKNLPPQGPALPYRDLQSHKPLRTIVQAWRRSSSFLVPGSGTAMHRPQHSLEHLAT